MLLAIDVSNTGIKLGLYAGRQLRARWRIATVREKTADEYAMLLASLCEHAGFTLADIDAVIVSSVVPPLTPVMQEISQHYIGHDATIITHATPLGVRLLTDNPWETGTDRLLSVLARKRSTLFQPSSFSLARRRALMSPHPREISWAA